MINQVYLHVQDGCQHKNLHIAFGQPGLISVTGHNACGKTNTLRLNAYVLTGIVDRSWGSQTDMARHYMEGGKKVVTKGGYVETCLRNCNNSKLVYVRRYFSTGAKYPDILWDDETLDTHPLCSGRKAVDAYLEELYHIPMRLLEKIIWTRQLDLVWLLNATSTSVDTFLKDLFDISKLKRVKDDLYEVMGTMAQYRDETAAIASTEQTLKEYKASLPLFDKDVEAKLAAKEAAAQAHNHALSDVSGKVTKSDKEALLAAANSKIACTVDSIAVAESALTALRAIEKPAEPTAEHLQFVQTFRANRRSLQDSANNSYRTAKSTLENLYKRKADEQAVVAHSEAAIKQLEAGYAVYKDAEVCPLCTDPISDRAVYDTNLRALFVDESSKAVHVEAINRANINIAEVDSQIVPATDALAEAEKKLQQIEKYIADGDSFEKTIEQMQQAVREYAKIPIQIQAKESELQGLRDTLASAQSKLADAQKLVVLDDDKNTQVETLAAALKQADDAYQASVSARVQAHASVGFHEKSLAQMKKNQEENKRNDVWYKRLARIREATQNNRIPFRFLASKIKNLNEQMAFSCRVSQVGFRLFLDEDKHTFFFEQDGCVSPAGQLSGGQGALAATILQLSIIQVVSPELGVFMLDEPDAYAAGENKQKMCLILSAISDILSARKSFVLMPTHDESMRRCCKADINIEACSN